MAKLTGKKPDVYLPAKDIKAGGIYVAQNGRAYKVDSIRGHTIECRLVRKSGSGFSKYSHKGVYAHSVFFTEELEAPPPIVVENPVVRELPWSRDGRNIKFNGIEQFYVCRSDGISGAEADRMAARIVMLLNIQDA